MKPICSIDGCNNNCMSNGNGYYKKLCSSHHRKRYNIPINSKRRRQKEVLFISKEPCFNCGWNKSYCDRHRIINGKDGGKYKKGNVIPLCPNCHRVEHNKSQY